MGKLSNNQQAVVSGDYASQKKAETQNNIKSILKSPSSTLGPNENRPIDSQAIENVQKRVKARALFNNMIEQQTSQNIMKRLREGEAKRSVFMNILHANKSERRYALPRDPSMQMLSQHIL